MNFSLARDIYGTPWFMDVLSIQQLFGVLDLVKNGQITDKEEKNNQFSLLELNQATKIVKSRPWTDFNRLDSEHSYISIVDLNGPITKNGGQSHYGTKDIAKAMSKAEKQSNIIGHIIQIDSGGGAANAVAEMRDVMSKIKKPIVSFVDGMMASAALKIGIGSDYVISHRKGDIIGSIGTMIELGGYPSQSEDKQDNYRRVRVYADQSVKKNYMFEEAINNFNFVPVKEKLLNPLNIEFIADVKNKRPNVTEEQLTGEIFTAKETVGTLIDEIGPFSRAIEKVKELSQKMQFDINLDSGTEQSDIITTNETQLNTTNETQLNINNQNSVIMNKLELKNSNPSLYQEILNEGIAQGISKGVAQEKERSEAWLVFNDISPEEVKKGIEGGGDISQKFIAEMSRKAMAKGMLNKEVENSQEEIEVSKDEPVIASNKQKDDIPEEALKEVYAAAGLKEPK
jgi:protease-4